ncbi:MAG TPA: hypothetical protein V6C90_20570 [Coleofasciculaceae cyanobacterium]
MLSWYSIESVGGISHYAEIGQAGAYWRSDRTFSGGNVRIDLARMSSGVSNSGNHVSNGEPIGVSLAACSRASYQKHLKSPMPLKTKSHYYLLKQSRRCL